jgi:hypothetical protein
VDEVGAGARGSLDPATSSIGKEDRQAGHQQDEPDDRPAQLTAASEPCRGVKFGRKSKLSEYQRQEALKRRAGETLAEIAKSYAVDVSMISRLR